MLAFRFTPTSRTSPFNLPSLTSRHAFLGHPRRRRRRRRERERERPEPLNKNHRPSSREPLSSLFCLRVPMGSFRKPPLSNRQPTAPPSSSRDPTAPPLVHADGFPPPTPPTAPLSSPLQTLLYFPFFSDLNVTEQIAAQRTKEKRIERERAEETQRTKERGENREILGGEKKLGLMF